jgi:alkanesulfonate monooxygenase SsuD/methylene tetrahydromethanopterin reductase-like flavin-dependent oxidoreductase (luciferase family)
MGMLVIPQKPWAEHRADYDHFVESCAKFSQPVKKPIVVAFIYCAESDSAAEKGAMTWMPNYADTALRHYEYDDPEHFRAVKGYEYHVKMAEAGKNTPNAFRDMFSKTQCYGSPERCVEMLRTIASTMDAAEFVGVFKYGGMPLEEAQRSMKLFATEVLPHIQSGTSPASQVAAAGR